MILVHSQGKSFNITVIQVYAPTTDAEEAEVDQFYKDLWDLELTPKNMSFSSQGSWIQMPKDIWSNRQVWLWSTNLSRAEAKRILWREHTGHSKHPLPTTQDIDVHVENLHMDITRWSTPKSDWLYSLQPKMEKLYTVSKNKTRSWLWLRSWTSYCKIQI